MFRSKDLSLALITSACLGISFTSQSLATNQDRNPKDDIDIQKNSKSALIEGFDLDETIRVSEILDRLDSHQKLLIQHEQEREQQRKKGLKDKK